jgi:Ca2+-binding EF-hand superfamily protein
MGIINMLNKVKDLLKKLFGLVDTNNDGKIDITELNAAVDKAEVKVKEVKEKVETVVKKTRGRKPKV